MSLAAGTRIGAYEIVGPLGAGGMGEVYRARDTRLHRDVAIKVLPDLFGRDPERLARFTREAQTLASLNHPNIAQIYGTVELPADAGSHIVMELAEGDELSAVMARGRMPIDEAIAIARQMADALEAAHERGIVHRDLKPANVKVTADGAVKVLDFGLAKATTIGDLGAGGSGPDVANSPTFTSPAMTGLGVILGTAAYMSPEQARGKAVDKRADIWAFGVVLYEMLAGRRLFEAEGPSEMIAAVLRQEIDWTLLPRDTPPRLRHLLERCLERDPKQRLRDIGEARIELTAVERNEPAAVTPRPVRARWMWPAVAAVMTLIAAGTVLWFGRAPAAPPLTRLSLLPPPGTTLHPDTANVAVSPDGSMVAFIVGRPADAETQLWVRSLDTPAPRRIEGADGALLPFWSPDSTRIGFFTRSRLATVPAAGGRIDVVCSVPAGRGAVWTPSNVILFARDVGSPLYTVPASGGTPVAVTTLDASRKESSHRFPTLLPDGDHYLYAALPAREGKFDVYAASLTQPGRTLIGSFETAVTYADPGWLLFERNGVLTAQRFDTRTRTLTGTPVSLDDEPGHIFDPQMAFTAGRPTLSSSRGVLAYYSAPSNSTVARWYDMNGKPGAAIDLPAGHFDTLKIAPDGKHAVLVRSMSASESSLWLADLTNGGASPLAALPGRNDDPVWSPDGSQVAFSANGSGIADIFVKRIGDGSQPRLLYRSDVLFKNASAWSPDGRWITVTQIDPGMAQDIWVLPSAGGPLAPYFSSPRRDVAAEVSPDGRWLAYLSDETGRFQLYVQSFPAPGHLVQVSSASVGAFGAWWTRDGRSLLFLAADRTSLWRVPVTPGSTFAAGTPSLVMRLPPDVIAGDVAPDGERVLALTPERSGTGSITVVQNWHAALNPTR